MSSIGGFCYGVSLSRLPYTELSGLQQVILFVMVERDGFVVLVKAFGDGRIDENVQDVRASDAQGAPERVG